MELTHVAGMHPTVAQGRRRRFGFFPVALEGAGAGWHDLADLAGRHVGPRDGVEHEDGQVEARDVGHLHMDFGPADLRPAVVKEM